MNDLVVSTQLRELVSDLMETVWAARDHRLHLVPIERADRVLREHLIEVFVAHAPGGIAVAMLLLSEDREVDAGSLENSCKSNGDLLRAVVERAHASDPEQNVWPLTALHRFRHRPDVEPL